MSNLASIQNAKGLYYPSQQQVMDKCMKQNTCNTINKDLLRRKQNISNIERISQILNSSSGGSPTFVLNSNENGTREGQPGGTPAPLRNRF